VFLTIFGTLVGAYIVSNPRRIKSFTGFLPKLLNSIFRPFRRQANIIDIAKVEATMEDLHRDYLILSHDWKRFKWPFVWAMVVNLSDLFTILIVYLSFGNWVNPGAIIIAYAVANFAGTVAILPGGVGIYEGLMTATMASAGVNRGLALSATLVYRVIYMVLFLPPGYFLYQRFLKRSGGTLQIAEAADADPHPD
jgi:uncharacterized protein (TIRG00374 family)